MKRLQKIDCCFYCSKNESCHRMITGETDSAVCTIDQPEYSPCNECDIYIKFKPCRDFKPKAST